MSLRFYFGSSGSGKSTKVYREMIRRSMEEKKRQFLIVVPDQFTMQTQKELVRLHERGGIMNIDVLSFSRLAHRVLEEVGGGDIPVLDDTGKSLVLRRVASELKPELKVIGSNLDKQGYIHEVKSAISEFMQYGIGYKELEELVRACGDRKALSYKLEDIRILYEGFVSYIREKYITTEETMDLLRKSLSKSGIVKNSVVVFDGFTGFTPIQYRVIGELFHYADEVIVTLTLPETEDPFQRDGEQNLFHLSRKTAQDLVRLAQQEGIARGRDVYMTVSAGEKQDETGGRFRNNPCLAHLERHLFRYPLIPYRGETDGIMNFYIASTPKEEVLQTAVKIMKLVREQGYCYRDIAVITGDMQTYGTHVEEVFEDFGIPCFLDCTRGILLNPFIESIRSALGILIRNFSYESVFLYLRSGMAGFTEEETDVLENYVLETGIRGKSAWGKKFSRRTGEMGENTEPLERLNGLRERLMERLEPLLNREHGTAAEYVEALYDFLTAGETEEKLKESEAFFKEKNDLARAREYGQIYRLVMDLLDQIYFLIGKEEMTVQEFLDILNAGFSEIEVGTIPQNVDRVLIGDMERTRLTEIRALFFIGVNDGNIPKNCSKGGILSDLDREFLSRTGWELSPAPRQQMFIQRFYLYLNLTKPKERLYLSCSKVKNDGSAVRPSYLLNTMKTLYPSVPLEIPEAGPVMDRLLTGDQSLDFLADLYREYASGRLNEEQEKIFCSILTACRRENGDRERTDRLEQAAFSRYLRTDLSKVTARAIYGSILENSVSRLELFASCAYAHFLQYGLALKERKEYGFENVDMGNVFHKCLEKFADGLKNSSYTWLDFPEEYGKRQIEDYMDEVAAEYGNTVLYSDERSMYAITRMKRILERTVSVLQNQLQKGSFRPVNYEVGFRQEVDLDQVDIALTDQEKMYLKGRIDRVDLEEDGDSVYVKIIDYKSGEKQFDLVALYYGLQLQLVVYMNAAVSMLQKKHPGKEIIPAALLYYHVADPSVEMTAPMSPEEVNEKLLEELRMNGVVNSDPDILRKLDGTFEKKSAVIPVERKKDGNLTAGSSCMSTEELKILSRYVTKKTEEAGRRILDGEIEVNPYEKGNRNACTYCRFRGVCGFDRKIPGYRFRELENVSKEDVWDKICEEICLDPEKTESDKGE